MSMFVPTLLLALILLSPQMPMMPVMPVMPVADQEDPDPENLDDELPRLTDLSWFPKMTREETYAEWQRWCRHVDWLRACQDSPVSVLHQSEMKEWIAEAERIRNAWDWWDDAHIETNSVRWRRERLARFREVIGRDAYYRGWLPKQMPREVKWVEPPKWEEERVGVETPGANNR